MSIYYGDKKERTGRRINDPPTVRIKGKAVPESTRCMTPGCGHSLAKHYEDKPHACSVAPYCGCKRFKLTWVGAPK
jgi:hypothetical protein